MIADGRPANPEDLLIHYALRLPYVGQHGDDDARWQRSFGPFPADAPAGLGMAEAPRASRQTELAAAIRLVDAVLAEADRRDARVSVAVVDRRGDPIQHDSRGRRGDLRRVPGARARGRLGDVRAAEQHRGGALVRDRARPAAALSRRDPRRRRALDVEGDRVGGGLGVAGVDPALAGEIAAGAALAAAR